jgi:hypothetical protein
MSQSACPKEGANALDCAENGASRQLGAPKVAWKRRLVSRNEFTALFQKAGSFITGADEACQSVPLVKGVDYNSPKMPEFCRWLNYRVSETSWASVLA